MRRVVRALIESCGKRSCTNNDQLAIVNDSLGSYLRYVKAFLGINYNVFGRQFYDITIDPTIESFNERVRLDANGDLLDSPSCKEVVGIRVKKVLAGSPLDGVIRPGDVITHINCLPLGNLHKQIAPSLITWRLPIDCPIEISYRRGGSWPNDGTLNSNAGNYEQQYTVTITPTEYPQNLDFPVYSVGVITTLQPFSEPYI